MKNLKENLDCFEPVPYVYILWYLNDLILTQNYGIDLVDCLSLQPRNTCDSFILWGNCDDQSSSIKSARSCRLQAEVVIVRV